VHPQHTMQLLTALAVAGKDAELRFFPPGAHGAAFDFASYLTMTEVYRGGEGCGARGANRPVPVPRAGQGDDRR
jgi:hypothetical protein